MDVRFFLTLLFINNVLIPWAFIGVKRFLGQGERGIGINLFCFQSKKNSYLCILIIMYCRIWQKEEFFL